MTRWSRNQNYFGSRSKGTTANPVELQPLGSCRYWRPQFRFHLPGGQWPPNQFHCRLCPRNKKTQSIEDSFEVKKFGWSLWLWNLCVSNSPEWFRSGTSYSGRCMQFILMVHTILFF